MRSKGEILKDLNDPKHRRPPTRQTFFEDCQMEVLLNIQDELVETRKAMARLKIVTGDSTTASLFLNND